MLLRFGTSEMSKPETVTERKTRRRSWTACEAGRVLSAKPEGLSWREYAQEVGIDVRRLPWWRV